MLFLYRVLINFVVLISPIIIIIRLLKNKESLSRFKEKFCFFSKKRRDGKIIWFHGASVGEILSIVPILEKYEKDKSIKKILLTTSTLSSSKVIKKLKFKKIIHQFYPLDHTLFAKKFLNHWKPKFVIFIEAEIWPAMFREINKKKMATDEVVIVDGLIRTLDLVATIKIDEEEKNNQTQIINKVRDKILTYMNVDNRDFGQALNLAELNRQIFEVDEVRFSTIDNLEKDLLCKSNEDPIYLIGHNCFCFDELMLKREYERLNRKMPEQFIFLDTLPIVRALIKDIENHKQPTLKKYFNINEISEEHAHTAMGDVLVLAEIWEKLTKIQVANIKSDALYELIYNAFPINSDSLFDFSTF